MLVQAERKYGGWAKEMGVMGASWIRCRNRTLIFESPQHLFWRLNSLLSDYQTDIPCYVIYAPYLIAIVLTFPGRGKDKYAVLFTYITHVLSGTTKYLNILNAWHKSYCRVLE